MVCVVLQQNKSGDTITALAQSERSLFLLFARFMLSVQGIYENPLLL